jgi:hypothetical protein
MAPAITLASSYHCESDSNKADMDSFRKQAEENEGQFAIINGQVRNGGADVDFSDLNWTRTMMLASKFLFILPLLT